jgi:glycosyltransferase involved in cell wall biosynthesis
MVIMHLIDSLSLGGAERMSVQISNLLFENNFKVVHVTTRKSGPLQDQINKGIPNFILEKRNSLDFLSFFKLVRICKRLKVTHIHAHSSSVVWALLLKCFHSFHIIWHDHKGNGFEDRSLNRRIVVLFQKYISGVVVVSTPLLVWAEANFKNLSIKLLANFPVLTSFRKMENVVPQILCLANIRPDKDQVNLVHALGQLKKRGYVFNAMLVGNINNRDYLMQVKEAIKSLQLEDSIEFKGLTLDLMPIFSKADIGIVSSRSEGLPLSLLEYGLASLPVAATDVGECANVLVNEDLGIIVPKKDPGKLADAIEVYLKDPVSAEKIGHNFKAHVEKKYGSKVFLSNYIDFISKVS